MKYKIGERVYYKSYRGLFKVEITYIDRMGSYMCNLLGYNVWMFHSEIKPLITVPAQLGRRL